MSDDSLRSRVRRRLGGRGQQAAPARRQEPEHAPGQAPGKAPGPKPEVVREQTHYGPEVDAIVERQRGKQRRPGVDPDYDLVREHFDHYHYSLQSPELADRPDADPVRHFLKAGAKAKASPHPDFSLRKYLQRHPEHRQSEGSPYLHWLRHGRAAGEIADPADGVEPMSELLGLTPHQLVDEVVALRTDMTERLRTGTLGEMFAKAVELEPLIGDAWRETAARTNQLPLRNDSVAKAALAINVAHRAADFRRARVVLVLDRARTGADDLDVRLVRSIVPAIAAEDLVVVYTDAAGTAEEGRFPAGVRQVDFFTPLEGVGPAVRDNALVSLLRSFCADALVNVDSALFFESLAPFGKALAHSERLFLSFPATEDGSLSRTALQWLYPTSELVSGYLTDDPATRDRLREHFTLTPRYLDLFHVVGADGDPDLAKVLLRDATGEGRA